MQATSDKTASANFTQTGQEYNWTVVGSVTGDAYGRTGYAPYYQWGRKDAFRSKEYTAASAANSTLIYSQTSVTVATTIQNPTTIYSNTNDGNGTAYNPSYYNAWNATYTSYSAGTDKIYGLEKVVKTVCDPCPVGYNIPAANTFIAFNTSNFTIDGSGRKYNSGATALYFPYTSYRRGSTGGAIYTADNNRGLYWLADAGTSIMSRFLDFTSARVDGKNNGGSRNNGFPIRPVREN